MSNQIRAFLESKSYTIEGGRIKILLDDRIELEVGQLLDQQVTIRYSHNLQQTQQIEAALNLRDELWGGGYYPQQQTTQGLDSLATYLDNHAHTSRLATRLRQTRQDFLSAA